MVDPLIGTTMGGCRIESKVAQGAMGAVYRGFQLEEQRTVALKVMLTPALNSNRNGLERFFREARAAERIRHPNVVAVFDAGVEQSVAFMLMELVEGEDLDGLVRTAGLLPITRALEIMLDTAHGLAAAHETGVVHRDIKPSNILVASDGTAKIGDFGLVKSAGEASLTGSGVLVGTPHYVSPEVCLGQPVGPSSDLYSLGGTFFYTLTGQAPFGRGEEVNIPALLLKHAYQPPPNPARLRGDIPHALCRLVRELLAKHPDERPGSAEELAVRLEAIARAVARGEDVPLDAGQVAASERTRPATDTARSDDAIVLPARTSAIDGEPGDTFQDLPPIEPEEREGTLGPQELLLRAKLRLQRQSFRAAAEDFRQAARISPGSTAAWFGLARTLACLGVDPPEVLAAFRQVVATGCRDGHLMRRAVQGTPLEQSEELELLFTRAERGDLNADRDLDWRRTAARRVGLDGHDQARTATG